MADSKPTSWSAGSEYAEDMAQTVMDDVNMDFEFRYGSRGGQQFVGFGCSAV